MAEWFLVDRWDGSSAPLLPMEAQGIYRAMLSQAWRRGAKLPADPEAIQLLIRCKAKEWKRSWPLVKPYWVEEDGYLVNETQLSIYSDASARRDRAREHARAAARARHGAMPEHAPEDHPPSPSPSLPVTSEVQPTSSGVTTDADDAVESARSELRQAIQSLLEKEGNPLGLHQSVLHRSPFHSTSGGIVHLATCTSAPLMLATAAKVRAHGRPRPRRASGVPSWDLPPAEPMPDTSADAERALRARLAAQGDSLVALADAAAPRRRFA